MEDDLIYTKTQAGEEAVQERRRLVQRNLRMVLILVDGVVNVAGLKKEVGDAAMVESALAELERMGLITPPRTAEAELDASEIETIPGPEQAQAAARPPEPVELPLLQADTVFDEETATELRSTAAATPPAVGTEEADRTPRKSPLTDISGWWESARKERAQAREEAIYEAAYGKELVEEVDVRASKPGLTLVFRWSWLITVAVGLAAVALLTLVLFPYDDHRHDFEQRLGLVLGDEVTIGEVRLAFTPYPAIELDRVAVGSTSYVTADKIVLLAEYGSIFGPRYRQVEVAGMHIKEAGLDRFSKWFLPAGMGDAAVDHAVIDGLAVDLAGGSFGGLRGTISVDPAKGLTGATLRTGDGNLRIDATPGPTGVEVVAYANDWSAPFRPGLLFSYLEVHGQLGPGRLAIDSIDARLYDGVASGKGFVSWVQEPTLMLDLAFQNLAATQLLTALGTAPLVDGTVSGEAQVNAKAVAVRGLDHEMRIDGNFLVERGSLKHVDLAEAIKAAPKTVLRGGTTRFERFSGGFAADNRAIRLSKLRMAAGLMQVSGELTLSYPNQALNGWAGMEMRGSAMAAKSAVAIAGSAGEPDFRVRQGERADR
jgi:hypothetical protein